ncbi:MAG: ribose-phosphate pyrophosphokinase [Patescibacteria group bacterium]
MKLFAGTSNRPLAEKLGIPLGNVEITRFIDNECRVFVKDEVEGEDIYVLQSLSEVADQNLVELCLLGQALKDLHAKKVTAIIPWMGYSKQDKAFRKGEAISAQLVATFIESAGFDRVIACELHSENVTPFFHIPVVEVPTRRLLVPPTDAVVVSPDLGGVSRSETFAKEYTLPILHMNKSRDVTTGNVTVTSVDGEVKGKSVVIFDDIINTGETAVKTSTFLYEHGAKEIIFFATHAVLAGNASQSLQMSHIDTVTVTDTIDIPKEKLFPKLHVISISHELTSQIT